MQEDSIELIGKGIYTVNEAAALIGLPASRVRRWITGYKGNKNFVITIRSLEDSGILQICSHSASLASALSCSFMLLNFLSRAVAKAWLVANKSGAELTLPFSFLTDIGSFRALFLLKLPADFLSIILHIYFTRLPVGAPVHLAIRDHEPCFQSIFAI